MLEIDGEVYGFRNDGSIVHVSRQYRNDDGKEIDAYAEIGLHAMAGTQNAFLEHTQSSKQWFDYQINGVC
jgi:D-aminopeptidase